MRILLDESLPRPLTKLLTGHEVRTVTELRWTGLKNGALLTRAANSFDVLLTADQNIEFQQNLIKLPVAVVVLVADTNRLESNGTARSGTASPSLRPSTENAAASRCLTPQLSRARDGDERAQRGTAFRRRLQLLVRLNCDAAAEGHGHIPRWSLSRNALGTTGDRRWTWAHRSPLRNTHRRQRDAAFRVVA